MEYERTMDQVFNDGDQVIVNGKILHGILWKHYVLKANKYAEVFYGVLPARVEFLRTYTVFLLTDVNYLSWVAMTI